MKFLKYHFVYLWGIILILSAPYIGSTTFRERSFESMVRESDMVIEGVCTGKTSRFVGNIIMTVADIEVYSTLHDQGGRRDAQPGTIQIAYVGGEVEKPLPLGQKVQGGVNLNEGDRAYFILNKPERRNRYYAAARDEFELKDTPFEVKSMARGVFKIRDEQIAFNQWQQSFKREIFDKYAPDNLRMERADSEKPQAGWNVSRELFSEAVFSFASQETEEE